MLARIMTLDTILILFCIKYSKTAFHNLLTITNANKASAILVTDVTAWIFNFMVSSGFCVIIIRGEMYNAANNNRNLLIVCFYVVSC